MQVKLGRLRASRTGVLTYTESAFGQKIINRTRKEKYLDKIQVVRLSVTKPIHLVTQVGLCA